MTIAQFIPGQSVAGRSAASRRLMNDESYEVHPARVTIKHWQLRDLICIDDSTALPRLLYPSNANIHCLDLQTGDNVVCAALDFEPRCISVRANVLAAGGFVEEQGSSNQRGLLAIHSLSTDQYLHQQFGQLINNSITLYSDSGSNASNINRAIVCNNDTSLYFLDLVDQGSHIAVAQTIKMAKALNHASISPDRKTVLACGDFPEVILCHPEERTSSWTRSASIQSRADFGFSTDFSPSGQRFGVAFQDGSARIYDIRNYATPLHTIRSTRQGVIAGAFRCIKFSSTPNDLAIISEQNQRVHILDMRDFSNHQILHVPQVLTTPGLGHYEEFEAAPATITTAANSNFESYEDYFSSQAPRTVVRQPADSSGFLEQSRMFIRPSAGRWHYSTSRTQFVTGTANVNINNNNECGISGIGWSNHNGGSLIMGTDKGIGVWRVESLTRRTFPEYKIR